MSKICIIGGSGLTAFAGLEGASTIVVDTCYGYPSTELVLGAIGGREVVFLSRHGNPHRIPPHLINYRANITALKKMGVTQIIALNAVGGIHADMGPAHICIPDQIIDYTYDRESTFNEDNQETVNHIDFTEPFSETIRATLLAAAAELGRPFSDRGTYGCTQGPRLETAAEIKRMERDGCDIVGMTMMPEAALARELNLDYASICVVANWAAGKSNGPISMSAIEETLAFGMRDAMKAITISLSIQ